MADAARAPVWRAAGAPAGRNIACSRCGPGPLFEPTVVNLGPDPLQPAVISAGRSGQRFVDRYTGEISQDTAGGTRELFDTITARHRWFDADDENRATARGITGASNLAFLFLLVTGAYLWLPPDFYRAALHVGSFGVLRPGLLRFALLYAVPERS